MAELNSRKIAYYGYTGSIESAGASRIASALNTAVKDRCDEAQLSATGESRALRVHSHGLLG